jgi:hypothetical protein
LAIAEQIPECADAKRSDREPHRAVARRLHGVR